MRRILIPVVDSAYRLLCGLAIVALVMAGGTYSHFERAELSSHTHSNAFAMQDEQHGGHDHASQDADRPVDTSAIHCGADILDLSYRNRDGVRCRSSFAIALGGNKDDPTTPLIEPPPPRTKTFAL